MGVAASAGPGSREVRRPSAPRAILGFWTAACLGLLGCDPYSADKAELRPADRARFERGARAATPCWSCHDLVGDAIKVGPPLKGVFGRPAGDVKGFPYSPALLKTEVVWNARTMDAFLLSPQAIIPGNRMLSPPLRDIARRSDLVFFLSVVTRPSPDPAAD